MQILTEPQWVFIRKQKRNFLLLSVVLVSIIGISMTSNSTITPVSSMVAEVKQYYKSQHKTTVDVTSIVEKTIHLGTSVDIVNEELKKEDFKILYSTKTKTFAYPEYEECYTAKIYYRVGISPFKNEIRLDLYGDNGEIKKISAHVFYHAL